MAPHDAEEDGPEGTPPPPENEEPAPPESPAAEARRSARLRTKMVAAGSIFAGALAIFANLGDTLELFGLRGSQDLPREVAAARAELDGYFAANDIFNTCAASPAPVPICYVNNSQIRVPDRMLYLIDSKAGEVIEPVTCPYSNPWVSPSCETSESGAATPEAVDLSDTVYTGEVDFRYGNTCLTMLMDGHIEAIGPWRDLEQLEKDLRIHVFNPFTSSR